jgi:hypothetical protein
MKRLAAVLGAAYAQLLALQAHAESPVPTKVPTAQQAGRDGERLRILQTELAREHAAAAEASRRLAEHLVSGDANGAATADRERIQATDNVAALKREIAAATRAAGPQQLPLVATTPMPDASAPEAWWDVYAVRRQSAKTVSEPSPSRRP